MGMASRRRNGRRKPGFDEKGQEEKLLRNQCEEWEVCREEWTIPKDRWVPARGRGGECEDCPKFLFALTGQPPLPALQC